MGLYGDSHIAMWFKALDEIAIRSHWKLVLLSKGACPAGFVSTFRTTAGVGWRACNQWRRSAIARINRIDPALLLISQAFVRWPNTVSPSPALWGRGVNELLSAIHAPRAQKVFIGTIPSVYGPVCLYQHMSHVQSCSVSPRSRLTPYSQAESQAAQASGARYIDVTPWFCARRCSGIIGDYDVYFNEGHVALPYTRFLEGVLADAIGLQPHRS